MVLSKILTLIDLGIFTECVQIFCKLIKCLSALAQEKTTFETHVLLLPENKTRT